MRTSHVLLALGGGTLAACGRPASGGDGAPRRAAHAVVVDSAVPREVALERFQAGLAAPARLTGGASSRDALVHALVLAVEAADTAGLRTLSLTKPEFAFLYYPTNPQGLPPYGLEPGLLWFLLAGGHEKGLARLLDEYGGRPMGYTGHRCETAVSREGANTVSGPCVLQLIGTAGDTVEQRLFGLILERGGRFKFVSLANRL